MSRHAHLTITAYSDQTERDRMVRDIASEVSTARVGETWNYRGLTVQKVAHTDRSRRQTNVTVLTPAGDRVDTFPFDSHDTRELVERLDECRRLWVEGLA